MVNFLTKMNNLRNSNTNQRLIFVCVNGLKLHKIIINKKSQRKLLGIINLNEIPNWNDIKLQDNVTTVSLMALTNFENEKSGHFSFPFIVNTYKDLEKFTLEFRDIEDNLIEFSGTNEAFTLIQFFVGIQEKPNRIRII